MQTYRVTAVLGGQVPGSLMAARWRRAAPAVPACSPARRAAEPAVIMSAAVAAQLGDGPGGARIQQGLATGHRKPARL